MGNSSAGDRSPAGIAEKEHIVPVLQSGPLESLAASLFVAAGMPREGAGIVARSLVDSNLCGHDSHGIIRVPQYIGFLREKKLFADVPLLPVRETVAAVTVDAQWGLGQIQAYRLLDLMLPKARDRGIAAGSMRRCGHTGRLGEYAEWAASRNLAFVGSVNSSGSGRRVSPPGGTQGRISTNPLCIGVPSSDGEPVVLDIGTSAVAEGKVRVAFQKGERAPDGWLLDAEGRPSNDPAVLYDEKARGSILPFGGPQAYKGFGLGLMLDMLCGGLSGGDCSREDRPLPGLGNTVLFLLFDPEMFGGREHFLNETGRLAAFVRACPTAPGVDGITLPGDPERAIRKARTVEGIPIPDGTWKLLVEVAGQLGVRVE